MEIIISERLQHEPTHFKEWHCLLHRLKEWYIHSLGKKSCTSVNHFHSLGEKGEFLEKSFLHTWRRKCPILITLTINQEKSNTNQMFYVLPYLKNTDNPLKPKFR